jgi:hypothetical protein
MKLVYLRGKNPKILDDCGYDRQHDSFFRRLKRYDGVEWLSNMKVLGEICDDGAYEPAFPHSITPAYQKQVARKLGLKIRMRNSFGSQLYYYNGLYRRANELFGRGAKA